MPPKVNNEGETPQQERVEPPESPALEAAEVKAFAAERRHTPAPSKGMHSVNPGDRLPHESKFKK